VSEPRVTFELESVVHLVRPTGERARDLEQLRAGIAGASFATLFHHTLQCQLRDPAADELPPDDFSGWVNGVVQDRETAERISFAVQNRNGSAEELRAALLEILSSVPESTRTARSGPPGGEFVFLEVESVPVPTGISVGTGAELIEALASADASVCFYHWIEQPWFAGGQSPLLDWAARHGEARLPQWLNECAASGLPIEANRRRLLQRWRRSRLGRQVTEAAQAPEDVRREAGREAVARLVRRMTRTEPVS
jgi:hypothetical protein